MKSDDDKYLEALLSKRHIEPASPGFAERIIASARPLRRGEAVSIGAWLREALAEFMLPKPAFALAATLMLGMVIGFSVPASHSEHEDAMNYLKDDGAIL